MISIKDHLSKLQVGENAYLEVPEQYSFADFQRRVSGYAKTCEPAKFTQTQMVACTRDATFSVLLNMVTRVK